MAQKTLILIDGHALAFRSYFALERTGMKTTDNQPTWAVFGFFKAIFDLLKNQKIKPDSIAVTFDVGRQTFRTEEYAEYKANRESMPDTLKSQLELIMIGLQCFNIPIYTKAGFEADDVIGTICDKATKLGHKTYILTGDQDSFQLIDREGFVKVLIPSKGELIEYDWDKVFEKLSVYPNQVADYKGLRGDTSDNIPGIKGIGQVSAAKLLGRFQTLDNILENVEEIKEKALKQKIKDGVDIALLSRHLATIQKDVDIDFDFENTSLEIPDFECVKDFFTKLQFFGFLKNFDIVMKPFTQNQAASVQELTIQPQQQSLQLGLFSAQPQEEAQISKKEEFKLSQIEKIIVDTEDKFEDMISKLNGSQVFSIDTETTSIDTLEAELVGISIAINPQFSVSNGRLKFNNVNENNTTSYYIPVFHQFGEQLEMDYVLDGIKPILESTTIAKILQNAKYELNIFKKYDIQLNNIILDTMLGSYIKDASRKHGLKVQALEHLNYMMKEFTTLTTKGKDRVPIETIEIEEVADYACDDAYMTLELGRFWHNNLDEDEKNLLYDFDTPLTYVLADMEHTGVYIDSNYLSDFSKELDLKLSEIENKIYELAGEKFNINSPKQVGEILFNKLEIKPKGKTKTKSGFSTNAKILEELADEHEIAKFLLEQRHIAKLKSTYVDALPELISSYDGRIHTSYNQTVTSTGRLSSSNPNLQNIPIRTELGNRIRSAFCPQDKENSVIISADYSQIELRLLAHVTRDDGLIEAFCDDVDVHTLTASKVFEVPVEEVTKDMRRKAKAVNFGLIYGQSRYGLASTLGISPFEAQNFIDKYFQTYPEVKKYMDETVQNTYRYGYSSTMYGRKRYLLNELISSNHQVKEAAERAAINQPIQGAAADLFKLAMIDLYKKLKENNMKSKIILQVHDEMVLEVAKDELDTIKKMVQTSMELGQPLLVPLKIDIQVSESWKEV